MFDFAWSEIGLIAAVALVLIGPKDMPVAIRTITDMIKKARRMASEFQTHVDEMMREANLHEVRDQIASIRNFDVRGEIERHIDPDHALRDTFAGNPLEPVPASDASAEPALRDASAVAEPEPFELAAPEPAAAPAAPAFVPPGFVPGLPQTGDAAEAPAFIPPQLVLQRRSRPPAWPVADL
ncbi:MAG TPA: Sec-independent protein translocase protein TatB [Acetobacteraceae bacterium]|nr:Sec-independent protein translocase protein TatB [Acetobacteraceae bacterium]